MTVSTTNTTVSYTGDNTTTNLSVPFSFDADSDLVVIRRVTATGAETTLALTTDYTVTGGDGSTGTVAMVSAPNSSVTVTIGRSTAATQQADYRENDPFPAETHEGVADKLTRIAQENRNLINNRALLLPATESGNNTLPSSVDRANSFLAFDANGTLTVAASVTNATVSAFMETVLDDTTAAAARATLGAANDANVLKMGKHFFYADVSQMHAPNANAAASGNVAIGNMAMACRDFDAATRESMFLKFMLPPSYNLGAITVQPHWSHANTSGNFGVTWGFRGAAIADAANLANLAFGTQVNVSDVGADVNQSYRGSESANVTLGGTVAVRNLAVLEISREPSDGSDNLAVDARLLGVGGFITINASNDT